MGFVYTGCPPKKWNGWFLVLCKLKVSYLLTSLNKASSAEENDAKIIEFGWVILILCPFLETVSFSNFAWFLRPMSVELYRERPSMWVFWGSPLLSVNKTYTVSRNGYTMYKGPFPTQSTLIGHKNQAKLNMTVFQEMGIESKLLNQIQWSWYHSLLRKMLYSTM